MRISQNNVLRSSDASTDIVNNTSSNVANSSSLNRKSTAEVTGSRSTDSKIGRDKIGSEVVSSMRTNRESRHGAVYEIAGLIVLLDAALRSTILGELGLEVLNGVTDVNGLKLDLVRSTKGFILQIAKRNNVSNPTCSISMTEWVSDPSYRTKLLSDLTRLLSDKAANEAYDQVLLITRD